MIRVFFLLILSTFSGTSQTNTFEWGEGLSFYTGTFDTTNYSLAEIERIYNNLYLSDGGISDFGSIWKIEQMDTVSVIYIDRYFQKKYSLLDSIRIPKEMFWDSLKIYRKRELREFYEFKRLYILGLNEPSALLTNVREACSQEINALNGTDEELLAAWSELKERSKLNNGSPENVERRYQQRLNSPYKLKHARLQLMTYGWWNCMNQFIFHYGDYGKIEEEFQKIFTEVVRIDYDD